jgi:hypothetical protein
VRGARIALTGRRDAGSPGPEPGGVLVAQTIIGPDYVGWGEEECSPMAKARHGSNDARPSNHQRPDHQRTDSNLNVYQPLTA